MGVESGAQPIVSSDKQLILAVNGEIYNYRKLKAKLMAMAKVAPTFTTYSDCEVILHLYREMGAKEFVGQLDGIFSFVLYDAIEDRYLVARDPIGVTTLYYGFHSSQPETFYFASEMKCLNDVCDTINSFPPGQIYDSKTGKFEPYYRPEWYNEQLLPTTPVDYKVLRKSLEKSVKKRLMSEVPYGVLLSGGLDSSLIASIASRETNKLWRKQIKSRDSELDLVSSGYISGGSTGSGGSSGDEFITDALWPRLHSFSVGLPDKFVKL